MPFTDKTYINDLRSQIGLTDIRKVFIGETENDRKTFVLKFRSDIDVTSLCVALSSNPDVEYAEPNHLYYQQSNDPLYSQQWGLVTAKFDQAWQKYTSGKFSVLVAILDSGIDLDNISGQYGHPDLQSRVWVNDDPIDNVDNDNNGFRDDLNGFDFVRSRDLNGNGDYADPQDLIVQPNDDNGHGTAVAGIIGGITNNSIGISGAAGGGYYGEGGVKLMIVKVLRENAALGVGADLFAAAIRYAWQNGADVINMSLGGFSSSTTVEQSLDSAYTYGRSGKGCVMVGGTGNEGANIVYYPASSSRVMAVRAQQQDGSKYGHYGPELDVLAPGGSEIRTTARRANESSGYTYFGGTSAAAPHVSALAALMIGLNPNLTVSEVERLIKKSAGNGDYVRDNDEIGYGLINAKEALHQLQAPPPTNVSWQNISGHPKIIWQGDAWSYLYRLYRQIEGGAFTLIATLNEVTQYIDYQVEVQTQKPFEYFVKYYVTAYNDGPDSYSNWSRPSDTISVQSNMAEKRNNIIDSTESKNSFIPTLFNIHQNYPNPFNPTTKISYSVSDQSNVKITIFDGAGKEVEILVSAPHSPGNYDVAFNAKELSSGIYFYRMEAGKFSQTLKMNLLK